MNNPRLIEKMKEALVKANAQWRTQNQNKNHKAIRSLLTEVLNVPEIQIAEGSRTRVPDDSMEMGHKLGGMDDDQKSERSLKSSGSSN